jgi:hypothetical protein
MKMAGKLGIQLTDVEAGALSHLIKGGIGMGGADNIGMDKYGFLWTKTGQCLGWILEFI